MEAEADPQLSRRSLLGLLGTAAATTVLAACQGRPIVANLPENALIPDRSPYFPPAGQVPLPPLQPNPLLPRNPYGIIPRSSWGRGGPNLQTIDPMNGVALITFHHSGDPKPFWSTDAAATAQHLEWVRQYHVSRKFQDIGYHFAIDRAGRVWQLRSLAYQGQHVRSHNEHNIGVVVLGNFELQAPTVAQKDRIRSFAKLLRTQYKLAAPRVYTHREIVSTDCPGDGLQPYMIQVRKQGLV